MNFAEMRQSAWDIHARIAEPLSAAGLMLYAQHVDALDTGTLVDLFRADENA